MMRKYHVTVRRAESLTLTPTNAFNWDFRVPCVGSPHGARE